MRISEVSPPLSELPQRARDRQARTYLAGYAVRMLPDGRVHIEGQQPLTVAEASKFLLQRLEATWARYDSGAATQGDIDVLNASLAEQNAKARQAFVDTVERKIANHEPITSEEIEDYGPVPEGYKFSDDLTSHVWVWA